MVNLPVALTLAVSQGVGGALVSPSEGGTWHALGAFSLLPYTTFARFQYISQTCYRWRGTLALYCQTKQARKVLRTRSIPKHPKVQPWVRTRGCAGRCLRLAGIDWDLAIPGLEPLLAAGPILAALSGATGNGARGITGTLIGLDIPEDVIHIGGTGTCISTGHEAHYHSHLPRKIERRNTGGLQVIDGHPGRWRVKYATTKMAQH
jgi:hypothetical protein